MNKRSFSDSIANRKVFQAIGYTLVFLMLACGVMTLDILIYRALPSWHSGIIAALLLFIVIDRFYTHRHFASLTPLSREWALALGTQWILILVVSRFLLSYAEGIDSLRSDLLLFTRGNLIELITPEYVFSLLLALLFWYLTGQFLDLLDESGLNQELALQEEQVPGGLIPVHQRLVSLIFSLGIGLVIVAALTRVTIHAAASTDRFPGVEVSRVSGGEAGALLYFVFGLALLSLSRLMSLQIHWNQLRIPVTSPNLARQWGIYSIAFLLILAAIVSLLPAGDSLGFFAVLRMLLGFLMAVLVFLGQIIISLLFLLLSIPMRLFGRITLPISTVPPRLPTVPLEPVSSAAGGIPWALIKSILLWGALVVIVVFSLIQFVRQHEGLLAALRKSRMVNWLITAWQWLSNAAVKTGGSLSHGIAAGWQSLVARLERRRLLSRAGWINLRGLDPRRRIYFFYLAMLRRGAEKGLIRKPSQTPSEYALILEKELPSALEDIDSVTGAFIEARYSRRDVNASAANAVRAAWGRIRQALQKLPGPAKSNKR